MTSLCEACESAASDTDEPCDDEAAPYHLCSACHSRLHARALRPIEWYNLAKRHGWWRFLLHDDFYDEDGTASQPEYEVDSPHLYPAPTLDAVSNNPDALLDFTVTRWHFKEPVAKAWRTHSPFDVLRVITRRFAETTNRGIRSAALNVASTLGQHGENFVKYAWGDYPETVDLPTLAEASASCLAHRDGFDRVVAALSSCKDRERRDLMFSLAYFHSQDALDWIEANVFSPTTDAWGQLAAASEFDWPRAAKWLEHGRPLSLVALDALAAIIRPQSPLLRAFSPRLLLPPEFDTLNSVLTSHIERDNAPRVKMTTAFILKNAAVFKNAG